MDRVHKTPSGRLTPGAQPCMLLARMLRYKGKLGILAAAGQQDKIEYNGDRISFFPRLRRGDTEETQNIYSGEEKTLL
ncbi:hypothetical protein NDU88_004078 [Pleurodeles waltl]|uniref:Uncharacterized protein n=1 Tax=Pleurodeles waltl TaxID=8319 RepID=A0AAV7RKG5_PLEWA|nr:hypothetical protein NDU88_004078 [Pleurodeles waltl]